MSTHGPEGGDDQRPDSDQLAQAEDMGQPVYGDPSVTELDADPEDDR